MGHESKIEWTHHTFNPWWGCTKVSPGCLHCYAETFSKRTGHAVWGKESDRRFFGEKHWKEPIKWNAHAAVLDQRQRVFCASMADWLEDRKDLIEPLAELLALIIKTPHLDWLLLTKRPENWLPRLKAVMRRFENDPSFTLETLPPEYHLAVNWACGDAPENVWIGTTVEDQTRANERLPLLDRIPAKVRFLSCEPLLESVDLVYAAFNGADSFGTMPGIDWVICGGESGPHARPMNPDWARSLRDQCQRARVAFHFKQWGGTNKKATGRDLDGRTWDELPKQLKS